MILEVEREANGQHGGRWHMKRTGSIIHEKTLKKSLVFADNDNDFGGGERRKRTTLW